MMDAGKSKEKRNRRLIYLLLVLSVAILLFHQAMWLIERENCVCSVLTNELTQHELDERVRSICDCDASGTYLLVQMTCDHDVRVQLQVFPDEGYYWGKRQKTGK